MSTIIPRPDQVSALTRGQALPLPPLPETTLQTIAETLSRAWTDLHIRHAETLRNSSEAEVTSLLEIRLVALLDEDVCWEMLVRGISRGRECISYDGSHLEKKPDLSIHLTGHRFDFPLLIECKLVDRSRGKTVGLYCSDGLMRFVRGEYAWMSAEAFMLAYVRDGSTVAATLHPHLAGNADSVTLDLPIVVPGPTDLAHSRHKRLFSYLASAGEPGPIVLWHLWLPTPST